MFLMVKDNTDDSTRSITHVGSHHFFLDQLHQTVIDNNGAN